jgi:hypothetical protein
MNRTKKINREGCEDEAAGRRSRLIFAPFASFAVQQNKPLNSTADEHR